MEKEITSEDALKMVKQIKSTEEIKIGDIMMFTGGRGGIKIGSLWEMKTRGNIIAASIAIIEDRQNWRPLLDEHKPKANET